MKQIKFCPGCGHISISKIVEKFLQENKGILVGSVGCSVSLTNDMEIIDTVSSAHGRALSVATAARRVLEDDKVIVSYSGDGDCLTIGIGELVNTCLRNERIICVLINNQIFGMTGFQMSDATPLDMTTKTCMPRQEQYHGIPINVKKLVNALNPKVKYYRTHAAGKDGIDNFKQYLEEAKSNTGFTIIEIISPCVTYWGNAKKSYEYSRKYFNELNSNDSNIVQCKCPRCLGIDYYYKE